MAYCIYSLKGFNMKKSKLAFLPIVLSLCGSISVASMAAEPVLFGVIGDFGTDDNREAAVSRQISSWNPDFVITVGDNRYGSRSMDAVIGGHYCDFLTDVRSGSRCAPLSCRARP